MRVGAPRLSAPSVTLLSLIHVWLVLMLLPNTVLYLEVITVEKDQPLVHVLNAIAARREESVSMTPAVAKALRGLN